MNRSLPVLTAFSLVLLGTAAAVAGAAPAGAAQAAPRSAGAGETVIVELSRQYTFPDTAAGSRERLAAAQVAQAPVMASLRRSGATHISRLPLIDAVVATVSPAESLALAASPGVAEVVPDTAFHGPPLPVLPPAKTAAASALAPGVCPAKGKVQLNPEGVELVHAVSSDPGTPTARKLGFTGAGVTVGDMAVGINPDEPEMIRPDGKHVIAVYKDFSGEGTKVRGGEDLESYLDDSIMAAQGRIVYDLHKYTPSMPKGCDIRLQGVAPGITIDAYKSYGDDDMTTLSSFLETIDYAVDVNHVNILNEEGGWFPFPDDPSQDMIKAANEAAMASGVTITSPSYDAGPQNTIWSPSSEPGVISVGASTAFRTYAQDNIGEYSALHAHGWESDNISSLSSGGVTEEGRSIDVVAPGDLDWVACQGDKPACGKAPITVSGGTSEAGPLTAAVAALVIQAYRSTHHGATPSVSLIRDIISSSADDLGMPGAEQGSGLVDAYRAVKAAMAAKGPAGPALVASAQQLDASGMPGAKTTMTFKLTNHGDKRAAVTLASRTPGPAKTVLLKTLHRTKATKDQILHFRVARGAAMLTGTIASPGGNTPITLSLVNPKGQITAFSLPQGTGKHGQVEVRHPAAGTWTADVSGAFGPYTGAEFVQVTASPNVGWGKVSPRHVALAPGASTTITVSGHLPASPGDQSAAVTFSARGWGASTIPVTLRSLVPIVKGVGQFRTTLIGGNGRGDVPAQTFFYNFNVPASQPALDVQAKLGGSNNDPYYGYLIDPAGSAVAIASNQVVVKRTAGGVQTAGEPGLRLHTLAPPTGRWTLILTFTNPVNGNTLQTPLTGRISFAPVSATVHGLPDSAATKLTAGSPHTVSITVHNNSDAAEAYFLDGRLDSTTSVVLTPVTKATGLRLPLSDITAEPQWIVPTDTTALTATATSTAPTTFDFSPFNGDPDTLGMVSGDNASATVTAPSGALLTQGDWDITPQRIGPFGAGAAAKSTTNLALTATTEAFDPAMAPSTGDLWVQGTKTFAPVVVQPGKTVTLHVVITPTAESGSEVSGVLYLDDSSAVTNDGINPSGDQLEAIPYTYTVR
jgi:subtilase family protein